MIFALVVVLGLSGWWAYCYERGIYRVVHRPAPDVAEAPSPPSVAVAGGRPALAPPASGAAVAAVQKIERSVRRTCDSVLGWDAFRLTSTLAFDGTVLLSCRPEPDRERDPGELTLVLLIGKDERADRAVARLESWRVRGTTLRLRPTTVAGAIEVFDARRTAIRAPLLAA